MGQVGDGFILTVEPLYYVGQVEDGFILTVEPLYVGDGFILKWSLSTLGMGSY